MQNHLIGDGKCKKERKVDGFPTTNYVIDLQNSSFLEVKYHEHVIFISKVVSNVIMLIIK